MKQILKITNFKGIDNKSFEFDTNDNMLMFIGDHNTGKSTAMQAIETVLQVKGFVRKPIKDGSTEAKIEWDGQDLSNNPIKIIIDIEGDNTYSFTAATIVNNKMKTIHDPKKIKELVGIYYPLTAEEVLSMVKYTDGRKEFVQKYLLPLLTEAQRKRLEELQNSVSDKKNKATENNLYHSRTQLNKDVEALNIEIKAQTVTEEEKKDIILKPQVVEALTKLEKEYAEHKGDNVFRLQAENDEKYLNEKCQLIVNSINDIQRTFSWDLQPIEDLLLATKTEIQDNYLFKKVDTLYTKEQLTELEAKIERGRNKKAQIEAIERKSTPDEAKVLLRDKKMSEWTEKGKQIDLNKQEIKAIFSNSNLPAGIEIDEDDLILNGQPLDGTVSGETETKLAIIELLCNISTAKFVCLGNWSLYSTEARKKISALATKHNRIMIGQEISSDKEVTLQTVIIDK